MNRRIYTLCGAIALTYYCIPFFLNANADCPVPASSGIRQLTADIVIPQVCTIAQEAWSIESKAEVISSKIDTIKPALAPELWSIESKAEVISSKIDTIEPALAPELWSIESKAEVISSKIDTIEPAFAPELWSIESKAEVISSKIDTIEPALAPELWSIESKAEVISSKVDWYAACGATPIFQPADKMLNLTLADNYCLATDIEATVSILAPNVNLCLNNRTLTGKLIVNAATAVVSNGLIHAPAPTGTDDAKLPAVALTAQAAGAQLEKLQITCDNSADSLAGRVGIKVWGTNTAITDCTIESGSAGTGAAGGHGIEIMPTCQAAQILTTDITNTGSGTNQPGGNGIQLDRGCANIEIQHCTFMSTGTGNAATGGLAIYDDSAATKDQYSSLIYNNFAYSTSNLPPYYIKNRGFAAPSVGVDITSGSGPANYANVYVPAADNT